MLLEGKIALVTGASRGIGRQIALTLAKEGAVVIVNYNGSAAKAEEVVREITEAGGTAEAVQCSVSDYAKTEEMMKDLIARYKRIDILVNNAGITKDNLLMKMNEEEYDAVLDTNLKGTFNCIKHISRQMLKQKGGPHHQYFLRFRRYGKCRAGQLLRVQGGRNRTDQVSGQRAGKPRHYGKCHCSGLY